MVEFVRARRMIGRRAAVGGLVASGMATALKSPAALAAAASGTRSNATSSYSAFLAGVREQAVQQGVPASIVTEALALTHAPNAKVLKLDRHQPEFTLTWAQYRQRVITQTKIDAGRKALASYNGTLEAVEARTGVDRQPVMGIWGMESWYGKLTGGFNVIDALATLAYDGRRSSFFRSELLKALQILGEGRIAPSHMTGSYAGAMGQPQFMPSAYLRYARMDGSGHANIWTNVPDVMMSIANYLAKCGWRTGEPWGQEVTVPETLAQAEIGREHTRTLEAWTQAGVRRKDGSKFSRSDVEGAIVRPDGPGTEAFMIYHNFNVIRRYNPSDYYALGVGLMGAATT